MATTPNTNMVTAKDISTCFTQVSLSDRRTKDGNVPPIGDLLVYRHKASMDIRLLGERATSLSPDLLTVVEEDVSEGGSDRSERETVGHGEGRGNEQRTVSLVSLEVEGGIVVDNAGDIVGFAPVVEGVRRDHGQEAGIPDISELRANS